MYIQFSWSQAIFDFLFLFWKSKLSFFFFSSPPVHAFLIVWDFPNSNIIIIENSNKFGLSQLHQLRGRVGRGNEQGICFLLYKKNPSKNAKKRIQILKNSNDGFYIAEEDMKLRGYGDVLGYQQSGLKNFKLADPIHHEDLFKIAEANIKKIELNTDNFIKYELLLKLFDKADIINQINSEIIN